MLCNWFGALIFPSFDKKIKSEGFANLYDFLLNQSNNSILYDYDLYSDIIRYFDVCFQIESNIYYFIWLIDLLKPFLITIFVTLFLLPGTILVFIYATNFYMIINKHWNKLKKSYNDKNIWETSLKTLAVFWETVGQCWHGHEIIGLENLPDSGPALFVYYHMVIPIDFYFTHSKIVLYKNRRMKVVCDKFLFKVPGFKCLLEAFEATPGSHDLCVDLLKQGHILAISPGGTREALFSDNYEIIWGNRLGFAKVAVEAKVPVIPVFTQNSREALRVLPFFKKLQKFIYEWTRLPLVPVYGLFPVKLITRIGKPIEYDESRSAEQLKSVTKLKLEELIKNYQRTPGSIMYALLDRFKKSVTHYE